MFSLGIVSFNQVSVKALIVADVESIKEDNATFLQITLLMLVYKKQQSSLVLISLFVSVCGFFSEDTRVTSGQTGATMGETMGETSFAQFAWVSHM